MSLHFYCVIIITLSLSAFPDVRKSKSKISGLKLDSPSQSSPKTHSHDTAVHSGDRADDTALHSGDRADDQAVHSGDRADDPAMHSGDRADDPAVHSGDRADDTAM